MQLRFAFVSEWQRLLFVDPVIVCSSGAQIYVNVLSTIVGQIIRRIPNKQNAPPLFENLEPIANLHGSTLPQLQNAVKVLTDGPSGVLTILLTIVRANKLMPRDSCAHEHRVEVYYFPKYPISSSHWSFL